MEELIRGIDKRVPLELRRINGEWFFMAGHEGQGVIGSGKTPVEAILNGKKINGA